MRYTASYQELLYVQPLHKTPQLNKHKQAACDILLLRSHVLHTRCITSREEHTIADSPGWYNFIEFCHTESFLVSSQQYRIYRSNLLDTTADAHCLSVLSVLSAVVYCHCFALYETKINPRDIDWLIRLGLGFGLRVDTLMSRRSRGGKCYKA